MEKITEQMNTIQKKAHRLQEVATPLGEVESGSTSDANVVMNRGGNQSNQVDYVKQDLEVSGGNFENIQDTTSAPSSNVNTPKFETNEVPQQPDLKVSPTLKTVNESAPLKQEEGGAKEEPQQASDVVQTRADGSTNIAGLFQLIKV